MKNTLSHIIIGLTTTLLAGNLEAQGNTNGWPIVPQYITTSPTTVYNGALGGSIPVSGVTLSPASTNSYTVGSGNQIFVGTAGADNVGFQFCSTVQTNSASTNLAGNITLRIAKTADGITPETAPSVVLTLNSTANTSSNFNAAFPPANIFTNLDMRGADGFFITSPEETNAGVNGPTNCITCKIFLKAPKTRAIPATDASN